MRIRLGITLAAFAMLVLFGLTYWSWMGYMMQGSWIAMKLATVTTVAFSRVGPAFLPHEEEKSWNSSLS